MDVSNMEDSKLAELRKSKRVDYYSRIICNKSIKDGQPEEYEEPFELILINVSAGGLGVVSERSFVNGTVLVMDLKLEAESYEKVTAKVMWVIKKGDMFRYGLEISNITGRLYSHLSKLDNSISATV